MTRMQILCGASLCLASAAACGGDDEPCNVAEQTGCDEGLVCEVVTGADEPACFPPVLVRGDVFDLTDDGAIEGARVVALDVNRAAASTVAVTDADGNYELAIPSTRDADGNPDARELTLRGDADGYQTFPGGVRQAIPVSTADAVRDGDGPWVLSSVGTEIGLSPFDGGDAVITGHVDLDAGVGAIVVAETDCVAPTNNDRCGFDAVVDRDGDFAILNLEAGSYTVTAYAPGFVHETADVELAAGETVDVTLGQVGAASGSISGDLSFRNAPGISETSVIAFVESTFVENLMRGAVPPGMRIGGVDGPYTFEGVPPGDYVVLGAFEDDAAVRDPDLCISGTDIVHVTVGEGAATADAFSITEALDMLSPADDEIVEDGRPSFSWVDDSSEEGYLVRVFDSLGIEVWSTEIPGVSGDDPVVTYDGAEPLAGGYYYQVRVTSFRVDQDLQQCAISTTEDLAGVFFVP